MLLLTALQPRYYPVIRGTLTKITTTTSFDPRTGRKVDPYRRAVEDFDPRAVIARCGLGLGDVRKLYEGVASAAPYGGSACPVLHARSHASAL